MKARTIKILLSVMLIIIGMLVIILVAYKKSSFTQDQAKQILLSQYPELSFDPGLPPHNFYYSQQNNNSWIIVYTTEASGLKTIFSADCYEVHKTGDVTKLGTYQANKNSQTILETIEQLDKQTCKKK